MRRLTIGIDACTETMALLVAVAWADGTLDDEEKKGIRDAAKTLNLTKDLRDRLETFMETAPELSDIKLDGLSKRDKEFAYVGAAWMANVAKGVDDKEQELLNAVGERIKASEARQKELTELATSIDAPPDGENWADGIQKLFKAILPKVEAVDAEDVEVDFE